MDNSIKPVDAQPAGVPDMVLQRDVAFLRDLAARMHLYAAPIAGFDQGDTDQLYALARRLEDQPAASDQLAEVDQDREDAERWRALMSSERFKIMGMAGFNRAERAVDPDRTGWLHFGIEVWDRHPAGDDTQGREGRAVLLAYVDHLRAALASTSHDAAMGEG